MIVDKYYKIIDIFNFRKMNRAFRSSDEKKSRKINIKKKKNLADDKITEKSDKRGRFLEVKIRISRGCYGHPLTL